METDPSPIFFCIDNISGVLLKGQENRTQVPTEGDLVVIHLPIMPPKPHLPIEVKPVFGYVTSIRRGFLRAGQFLHDLLSE